MYQYHAVPTKVVDGDTVDLEVDLGFHMKANLRFRLLDVDTPEVRGPERPDGLRYKEFVEQWFQNHSNVVVESTKTGKYGRWLGIIKDTDSGECLNHLLKEKMAAEGLD